MGASAAWCRIVFVGADGADAGVWAMGGPSPPDLAAVDALARTQLAARQVGCSIRLCDPCAELKELLDLVGLRREVGREPEGGEEVGVEEGMEFGDPFA